MFISAPRNAACVLLLMTSVTAAAQAAPDPHFYVGASVGRTELGNDRDQFGDQFLDLGFTSFSTRSENRDTGYRGFVGYQFIPYLAVEAAYVDLGRFEAHTVLEPAGTFSGRTKIDGPELSIVGRFPIGDRFAVYGRGGIYRAKVTTHYTGTGSVELESGNETQEHRASKATYALGASYDFSPHLGGRLEWARYRDLGDEFTGGKTDADLVSLGLTYRF